MKKKSDSRIKRPPTRLARFFGSCICLFGLSCLFSSCNATRVITNQSSYYQRGDTAVCITVKTVESYDATKRY